MQTLVNHRGRQLGNMHSRRISKHRGDRLHSGTRDNYTWPIDIARLGHADLDIRNMLLCELEDEVLDSTLYVYTVNMTKAFLI